MDKSAFSLDKNSIQVLSFYLNDQIFGIDIRSIQDILKPLELTRVPLADSHIEGVSNLRGRIVTAINLKKRILNDNSDSSKYMSIVIDDNSELYSLLVDRVGDVVTLLKSDIEDMPMTINPAWREVSHGVHQMTDRILILLDEKKIININQ